MTNPKKVKCPQCGQLTEYSPTNSFRPFCSERCQLIDLGEWAAGRYAIPIVDSSGKAAAANNEETMPTQQELAEDNE